MKKMTWQNAAILIIGLIIGMCITYIVIDKETNKAQICSCTGKSIAGGFKWEWDGNCTRETKDQIKALLKQRGERCPCP